jgi:regulator of sigma E protease
MALMLTLFNYLLLAFGLGFVIFFHELGHFLAAKYCDVRVEQFAVGFGPAIFSWRKGLGFRWGSSTTEHQRILSDAGRLTTVGAGPGETEYRLNWIPLGGYVKMLGQDDLRPGVTADDPRAYNAKPIRSRMLIVSSGVAMNVVLAAIGFMIVFLMGYPVPPPVVGGVLSQSPAARAWRADGTPVGLTPGDTIEYYNGKHTLDYSKIQLDVALTRDGETVPIVVRHQDGKEETLYAAPTHFPDDPKGLLALGLLPPDELAGLDPADQNDWDQLKLKESAMPDTLAVRPGDLITQINGKNLPSAAKAEIDHKSISVGPGWELYRAMDASNGEPIELTVRSPDGTLSHPKIEPHFQLALSKEPLNILGLQPRARVEMLTDDKSSAMGKLHPGDVIVAVDGGPDNDHLSNPTIEQIRTTLAAAGDKKMRISIAALGTGETQPHQVPDLTPNVRLGGGRVGLGIELGFDEQHLVVADALPGSAAAANKIVAGSTITAVDGQPVSNWFQFRHLIADEQPGQTVTIEFLPPGGRTTKAAIKLTRADIDSARFITFAHDLMLQPLPGTLKTSNPFKAIGLGVVETRDLILQFYVVLQRMATGGVSPANMMGPVGMFHAGAMFASRGVTWLLWFLANISANLAVVNFLPLPIVDGGLFTLLILEKIQGKPLSAEAQRIVQMVGLVLILGVFLMVTYQDIARLAGY